MSCEVKSKMHSEHHVYFNTKKSKDFNCIFELPSSHGFCINGATHIRITYYVQYRYFAPIIIIIHLNSMIKRIKSTQIESIE